MIQCKMKYNCLVTVQNEIRVLVERVLEPLRGKTYFLPNRIHLLAIQILSLNGTVKI